ncbi:MAG: hypothetical protein ACK55Z_26090, partial [bacterium]
MLAVLAHTVCPAVSNAHDSQIYFKRAYERTRRSIALPRNALLHLRVYTGYEVRERRRERPMCERGWAVGCKCSLAEQCVT